MLKDMLGRYLSRGAFLPFTSLSHLWCHSSKHSTHGYNSYLARVSCDHIHVSKWDSGYNNRSFDLVWLKKKMYFWLIIEVDIIKIPYLNDWDDKMKMSFTHHPTPQQSC